MTDVDPDFAGPSRDKAAEIALVDDAAIEAAVDRVIEAAVRQRTKEVNSDLGASGIPGPYPDDMFPTEADYQWVRTWFTPFYDRDPTLVTGMAASLAGAKGALNSGRATVVANASSAVEQWAGATRDDFKTYFLDPFPNAVANQKVVVDELCVVLAGYEAVLRQGRRDAEKIADDTAKVLDSLDDCTSAEVLVVLGIITAATTVIGAIPAAGAALGLGGSMALIRGGAQFGAAGVESARIKGDTVEGVLQSMVDGCKALQDTMDGVEQGLADALSESGEAVGRVLSAGNPLDVTALLPHEPNGDGVTDVTDGDRPGSEEWRGRR
ncbi:hypothetical protein LX16_1989 [Stackebrandtia albiflava]|uniref:Uncharacterized protein n=1 Tax=Stackebrandtia albiflava TaxID=406432 RepID=A0A562VEF6_9ACTN|nr:hypothetical protein [Stackebrandtia albiflava]TWJ16262.1 hypothetical protein LX16_1989 [Stackebrandtia albiflava]